jgi:hypothetical protein
MIGMAGAECNSAVIVIDMDESQSCARSAPAALLRCLLIREGDARSRRGWLRDSGGIGGGSHDVGKSEIWCLDVPASRGKGEGNDGREWSRTFV